MEFLLDAVDRSPLREEFADSHEQPDPVPLVLLASIGSGAVVLADTKAGSGCGPQNAGEGNDTARAGIR